MSYTKIPLSKGQFALVDDDDVHLLGNGPWHVSTRRYTFYARRNTNVNGKKGCEYMHRLILGERADGMDVDHINGNGLDNRRCNLRACTRAENIRNSRKKPGGTSKYKGVHFYARTNQWRALIGFNYKYTSLGYFETELEAAYAYDKAAREMYGEFCFLNFNNGSSNGDSNEQPTSCVGSQPQLA